MGAALPPAGQGASLVSIQLLLSTISYPWRALIVKKQVGVGREGLGRRCGVLPIRNPDKTPATVHRLVRDTPWRKSVASSTRTVFSSSMT